MGKKELLMLLGLVWGLSVAWTHLRQPGAKWTPYVKAYNDIEQKCKRHPTGACARFLERSQFCDAEYARDSSRIHPDCVITCFDVFVRDLGFTISEPALTCTVGPPPREPPPERCTGPFCY